MKRKNLTKLLIAAAVVTVMAATVIAGGQMLMTSSHSYHSDDYYELPTAAWAGKMIGAEPKMVEQFSNGYTFDHGGVTKNEITTEGNSKNQSYISLDLTYMNAGKRLSLDLNGCSLSVSPDAEQLEQDGLTFYYTSYIHKIVPPGYQETEEDKAAVERGEMTMGWGADEVELHEFQALTWEQDGVQYSLNGHDTAMEREELVAMACELMAS